MFASKMRDGLLRASVAIGMEVMGELVDAEVTDVAGPKGRHDPDRSAYRHGTEAGQGDARWSAHPGAPAAGVCQLLRAAEGTAHRLPVILRRERPAAGSASWTWPPGR